MMFPNDVTIAKVQNIEDERGVLEIIYEGSGNGGIALKQSFSKKGVFRGMHYQAPPSTQMKIIRVLTGRVLDVIIDMRQTKETYGHIYCYEIKSNSQEVIRIPEYYAHGFVALEDSVFQYITIGEYSPPAEMALALPAEYLRSYGIDPERLKLSQKDKKATPYNEYFKRNNLGNSFLE